jgi:hypothetical protein
LGRWKLATRNTDVTDAVWVCIVSGRMVRVIDTNQIPRGSVTRIPPVIAGEVGSNSSVNYGLWMFMVDLSYS